MSTTDHSTKMHAAKPPESDGRAVDTINLSTTASKREVKIPARMSFFIGIIVALVFVIILLILL